MGPIESPSKRLRLHWDAMQVRAPAGAKSVSPNVTHLSEDDFYLNVINESSPVALVGKPRRLTNCDNQNVHNKKVRPSSE